MPDTIVSAADTAMSKILPSWTLHSERGRSAINRIKSRLMGMRNMEKEGVGGAGRGLAEPRPKETETELCHCLKGCPWRGCGKCKGPGAGACLLLVGSSEEARVAAV